MTTTPKIWLPANPTEVIVKVDDKGKLSYEQQQFNMTMQPIVKKTGLDPEWPDVSS